MRLDFLLSARLCSFSLAFFLMARAAVGGDAQDFTLQVTPTAVELPQGREGTVLVLLQNGGSNVLVNPQVTTFSNPPFEVQIEPKEVKAVWPNGTVAWTARISSKEMTAVSGNVYFRVDFTRRAESAETNVISITTVASLMVTSQVAQPLAEIAEVKVETTAESLNEKRPGTVHLLIKSKANVPLTVEPFRITGPDYLTIQPIETNSWPRSVERRPTTVASNSSWLSLAPFESRVVAYKVMANSQVTPGKQFLVFEVPLTWERGGYKQSGVIVATQQIEVGVFGESAILAALGVPTFLFLPGFLMLATFGFLYNFRKSDAEKANYPLKANTPDFYLLSITLSMAAFAAYPFVTKTFTNVSRDILGAYGLSDVVAVWFGSVILGFIAFMLVRLVVATVHGRKERRLRAYQFSTADTPLEFLRKLVLRKRGIVLERIKMTVGANTDTVFRVEEAENGKWWVAPTISMKWHVSDPPNRDEEKVTTAIDEQRDTSEIVKLLEDAIQTNRVGLGWTASAVITKLQTVDQSTLGETLDSQPVLEIL